MSYKCEFTIKANNSIENSNNVQFPELKITYKSKNHFITIKVL
jgi:hypothetical protein